MEVPEARKKRGVFRSGIDPSDGAWNDPWGNFYRIRIGTDSTSVESPYFDGDKLPTHGIAWSLGKDGIQGNRRDPTSMNGSDDIHSWR